MLIQQIINGLTNGSIYALIAVGVSMVFKSMGMLNMAHGDTLMISTYLALILYRSGVPLWRAVIIAIPAMVLFGFFLERYVYRRLNYNSFANLLIATIGVSTILRNSATFFYAAQPQSFPAIFPSKPVMVFGNRVSPATVGIICVGFVMVVLLNMFYNYTTYGKLMRAAASDSTAASMLGIDVQRMRFLTFGLSAGIATVAGILMAPTYIVRPTLALVAGTKGFSAAIIGGLGDINGAVIGGLLLGIAEALASAYISSSYRDVIAFLLMLVTITLMPNGIRGKRIEQKL